MGMNTTTFNPPPAGATEPATGSAVDVLVLLRRIMRAADLHSRRLVKATGLTVPQLLVLRAIQDLGEVTAGRVSAQVSLSQATVSTILDRLEGRGLIERYRSAVDRRVVHTRLTAAGEQALAKAPPAMQERFIARFEALPPPQRIAIIAALRGVAEMMETGEDDPLEAGEPAEAPDFGL
jgi:DNA-binding MarR family transcriptional regulator